MKVSFYDALCAIYAGMTWKNSFLNPTFNVFFQKIANKFPYNAKNHYLCNPLAKKVTILTSNLITIIK